MAVAPQPCLVAAGVHQGRAEAAPAVSGMDGQLLQVRGPELLQHVSEAHAGSTRNQQETWIGNAANRPRGHRRGNAQPLSVGGASPCEPRW